MSLTTSSKRELLDYITSRGFPHVSKLIELAWGHPEIRDVFRSLTIPDTEWGQGFPKDGFPKDVFSAILKLSLMVDNPETDVWSHNFLR